MGELQLQTGGTLSDFITETVRAEAARRGYSQRQLAQALDMPQPTCSTRWRGCTPWSVDELDQLAELFECNIVDLITGDVALIRRTPAGGSHRGGPLRARRDSNPQPSDP